MKLIKRGNETTRPRIFIVDDEAIIAMDLQDQLSSYGYDAYGYEVNGDLALERILESKPDLLLMDINLHGRGDGIDIVEQLYRILYVPVIYITAYSSPAPMSRAAATRPCGYLSKPFTENELKAAIEAALEGVPSASRLDS
jgi:CheY-like chemotaxis protein